MRTKAGLRSTAQDRRASHPPLNLDAQVAELVRGARRVAAYAAIGHEPQVTVQPGWLLPVVLPDLDLDWAEYDGTHAVSAKGLHEPVGGRLGVDAIASCDLVLVPALLVDRTGTRLGKGGGCYDRALLRATGLTVALVYDDEVLDDLPCERHDVPVQAWATPSQGVVRPIGKM